MRAKETEQVTLVESTRAPEKPWSFKLRYERTTHTPVTYVEDTQVPFPQRFPDDMARLRVTVSPAEKISRESYFIAAVSSVTPLPVAP